MRNSTTVNSSLCGFDSGRSGMRGERFPILWLINRQWSDVWRDATHRNQLVSQRRSFLSFWGKKGSNSQDISMTPKTTDLRGDCWGIDGLLGGRASQIGRNMGVFLRWSWKEKPEGNYCSDLSDWVIEWFGGRDDLVSILTTVGTQYTGRKEMTLSDLSLLVFQIPVTSIRRCW
jgi:hypothetical protein